MHVYKKYAKNAGLATFANVVVRLKSFVLLPILTKTLGPELYGIFTQIFVTISLIAPFCTLRLGYAIIRFLGPEKSKDKISRGFYSISVFVLLIGAIASILLFVLSRYLASNFFGGVQAAYYIKISAILVVLFAVDQIIIEYFEAFQEMAKYAIFLTVQSFAEVIFTAYLVYSGLGLLGAILSVLITRIIVTLLGYLWIKSRIGVSVPNFLLVKSYLPFCIPILPTIITYWFVNSGDRYIIGYFKGAYSVGVYSAAYNIGSILNFFYVPLSSILLPAISRAYEDNRMHELKNYLKYSYKILLMLSIPSFFALLVLSRPLLNIFTSSEFSQGYAVIIIVALATIFFNCGSIGINILFLLKKTKTVGVIYGFCALFNIGLNILLVPLYGIIGAAIVTLSTFIFFLFVTNFIYTKKISFEIDLKFIAKNIISSIVMAFLLWKINPTGIFRIIVSAVFSAVVYFTLLVLLKGFSRKEYSFLKSFVPFLKD